MQGSVFFRALALVILAFGGVLTGFSAQAEPMSGIAMRGKPALDPARMHLPYADPDAPSGGQIRMGESGSYDSLNPWILQGRPAQGISTYVTESLMLRSFDEPFTLYGLLAESIETDESRSWVSFTLRPEARFSDGSPVTVEDVIWSFETIGTLGAPRYQTAWKKVKTIRQTGPRSLRIDFAESDRELTLLMGLRPILSKKQWQGHDFAAEMQMVPIGSGPYVVESHDMGRSITLKRNPEWWAKDLPITQGLHHLMRLRWDYFGDQNVMFEAFKAGEIDLYRELNAANWLHEYDFPAVTEGRIVKDEIASKLPSGIKGLVMNTRKPVFADWRVRQAMILAFNFEFMNKTLTSGTEPRISSYFANSALAMTPGPATGKVADLLAPHAANLLPGTLEGYDLPVGDGTTQNRRNMRAALKLLEDAGWAAGDDGVLKDAAGAPFRFEIVLQQGAAESRAVVDIYQEALRRLGIFPTVTVVDDAQFQARKTRYDFDMTWMVVATSLSPGNEQHLYWGMQSADAPGSRNLMGMRDPVADAMIAELLSAGTPEDFTAAVQALDRVLMAGRYVIPIWYAPTARLAHSRDLHFPATVPLYGDWPGVTPDAWWHEAKK